MKKIYGRKYEVISDIAQGAMGCVYLVKDLHLNKLFALKMNKCAKEMFYRETEILKNLTHPLFPGIADFFEEEGKLCIVMEYVEGITLEKYLERFGKVEERQAVKWGLEIAEGISFLHSQKPEIIYRDLKPANIIIQPDGKVRLIDFGAAFTATYGQNVEQSMMGTPGYSAPEQWRWGQACKESDIYALGAVLYEMLTGRKGTEDFEKRLPVRLFDKSISRRTEKVIQICLMERAEDRYHSMEQVVEALKDCGIQNKMNSVMHLFCRLVGMILWALAFGRMFLPFLKGVKWDELPFPYLKEPMLLLGIAVLYQIGSNSAKRRKQVIKKCEKSVFLSEKKFPGLLLDLLLPFTIAGILLGSAKTAIQANAEEKKENLWVEMRDDTYRKLLLKEDAVYEVTDRLRFEIARADLPEGELALQIVAASKEGDTYESRVFLVEKGQDFSDGEEISKN